MIHYSDGCIVTVTNNMTHYIMMDVYNNGYSNSDEYTRVSE